MLSYSDVLISTTKALLMIWIASYPDRVSETGHRAYIYANSINGLLLTLVDAGIVFLVAEIQPLIWGWPSAVAPMQASRFSLYAFVHGAGWHIAFGICCVRLALHGIKVYRAFWHLEVPEMVGLTNHMAFTEDMLNVLGFFVGIWLLSPFWAVVSFLCIL